MPLSAVAIIPILDPDSLDTTNNASKVYPPQPGTNTNANDVGAGEQVLRNQTHTLHRRKARVLYHPAPAASNAPTYTETTTAFTLIDGVAFTDPPAEEARVGEAIDMTFTCTVTNTGSDAYVALFKKEPSDVLFVEISGTRVRIGAPGVPMPISLAAVWIVAEAGIVTVAAQGAKAAAGGTLSVVEAYRFEAKKVGTE